jgi:hypothetical protein
MRDGRWRGKGSGKGIPRVLLQVPEHGLNLGYTAPLEGALAQRPTPEELARHILKRLYEDTEGRSEWRTLATTNMTGEAAVELAVERGWLLVDGSKGVFLTEEGRAEVKKEFS